MRILHIISFIRLDYLFFCNWAAQSPYQDDFSLNSEATLDISCTKNCVEKSFAEFQFQFSFFSPFASFCLFISFTSLPSFLLCPVMFSFKYGEYIKLKINSKLEDFQFDFVLEFLIDLLTFSIMFLLSTFLLFSFQFFRFLLFTVFGL